MKNHSDRSRKHFLRLTLTLAAALSLLILGWLSWHAYYDYRYAETQLPAIDRMEIVRAEIVYLDEVLTMSAQMAAASGDLDWETRYLGFEPQLDQAIKEALRLDPNAASHGAAAAKTESANISLVVMEHRAFELVRQGKNTEAQRLLSSREYEAHKKIYAAGMKEFNLRLLQTNDSVRARLQTNMRRSAITTIASAVLLIFGSLFVFRATRRWQAVIVESNHQLSQRTADLGELNNQLDRKVSERTKELSDSVFASLDLARIGRSLTETLDIVAVGSRIVTSVRELFHVRGSTLRNLEADGSLRSLASSGDIFSQTEEGEVISSDMGLSGRAIKEGRLIWSADTSTDEEIILSKSMLDYKLRSGNGSIIVVPLRAHEKITGTLMLTDRTGRTYSDNELVLLQTFANQAALALVNAQLFETLQASKQQLGTMNQFLEHSLNKLGSLYTAMTPLALSESLGEMVNAIIERLLEATGSDAALIRIWDRDAGNYPVIGHRGYTDDFVEGLRPEHSEGALAWVTEHGEPIIAPDLSLEARFRGKRQMALGFQSCAILPLRVHGDIRGVIQLSSRRQGYFDAEQKEHLMAVARQMSVALENRELFYNLQASRNELERANKVKDEFLNVMSHELRTPLSVVVGYSKLLREKQLGPLTKEQEQGVDVIQRNSKELFTMIDSIMNATKIEAGSMIAEKDAVSPVDLLTELKLIYDFPTGKEIHLEWMFPEVLPSLWTDGRKLRQILTNLINNAVKFTDEGSIVISAEEKLEGDDGCHHRWIEFRVSDSGIGIPPEERDKIFERFHQVDSSATRSFEGVGLGLYIVKSFTEMLNGQLLVSSEVGHGSTFTVRIPCESIEIARANGIAKKNPLSDFMQLLNDLPEIGSIKDKRLDAT